MTPPANEQSKLTSDEDIDFDLLEYLQTLTPAERMARHEAALELVRALRKAGTELHGFDPRTAVTAR